MALDANTFDLSDIFTGNSAPREALTVVVNEGLAYELAKVEKDIAKEPENEELEEKRKELVKQAKDATYTFHIQGAGRSDILSVLEKVQEEFPTKANAFGRRESNPKADEVFADRNWALHIEKVEDSQGRSSEVDEEQAATLRRNLPSGIVRTIEETIAGISELTREGFEMLALETDFLSKR